MFDLPFIWAAIISFAVFMYVVLDGFDLGIGILFPFAKKKEERDVMMNTVAPVWDGNETWLVLGGGGLYAVFPLAYSVTMTALYAPLIIMLLALVFRGVAFEFRFKDEAHRPIWDRAFIGGSITAAFFQGIVMGAFVQGIKVDGRSYAGGWFDWLTPFSIFTGFALIAGYALLGACWLILKTEGEIQYRFFRDAKRAGALLVIAIAITSLWTPFLNEAIAERWFSWPNIAIFMPVPLLVAVFTFLLFRALLRQNEYMPFVYALGLFFLAFTGLGISLYPNIVPPSIDIWEAAAPDKSLTFLLVGTVVLVPMILAYTAYSYWVFRGKVRVEDGYH